MYANRMNNDMAVSPIVATLVLIVVAVIGAVAVGTIMGTFSTDVSKQANSQQAASASGTEILIAGSTTLIPAELNIQADYQKANPGDQINVQGGGSSAGPQSVAMGIADIGATSSASAITTAITNNANNPVYQNLYFTQVGGRGVVFIQDASEIADPTNTVSKKDLQNAYDDAVLHAGKTSAADGNISFVGTTMEQREAGSGTMSTAFSWIGGAEKNATATGLTGVPTNNGNAQMLAAVQAGTAAAPVVGFVDSGYAITGGVTSTTTASGIIVMAVEDAATASYAPTHANIKNSLKDWYYGNAQDITSGQAKNYPQGLVGGLYWITKGTSPSGFTGNQVTTTGTSSASLLVQNLVSFAKSPGEASAFNNAGMYSMYNFL